MRVLWVCVGRERRSGGWGPSWSNMDGMDVGLGEFERQEGFTLRVVLSKSDESK